MLDDAVNAVIRRIPFFHSTEVWADPSRTLAHRYLAALAAIAVLVMVDQAVVQPLLVRLNSTAPVINVAGRQRMLSQRLAKSALAIQAVGDVAHANANGARPDRPDHRTELRVALAQWTAAHHALLHGDKTLGIPPVASDEIRSAFAAMTPHYDAIRHAAETIVESPHDPTSAQSAAAVTAILDNEARYLPMMDRIVGLYERQAQRQVGRLRVIGLGLMLLVLALILVLGWFVIRPATRTIQSQIDELTTSRARIQSDRDDLDERVRQRTRELEETNRSLEREIEERQLAEERTQQLSLQLAHASRITAMGQLATGLAHELNQPLAAISNFAETAEWELKQDRPRGERVQEMLDLIRRSALRAGKLVRHMRNFVRRSDTHRVPTDIAELIGEVCELCRPSLQQAGVVLRIDVPADLPAAPVDRIQVQQVLLNLIHNAVQALQDHPGVARTIELSCRHDSHAQRLELAVADDGPGFSSSSAGSLDQPFFTTKIDGLGVGLAICRSLVRQHGGELRTANRGQGGGARVTFTLPLEQTHEPSDNKLADGLCR